MGKLGALSIANLMADAADQKSRKTFDKDEESGDLVVEPKKLPEKKKLRGDQVAAIAAKGKKKVVGK